jgi:hypothetical protein
MYQHYSNIHFWARVAAIRSHIGRATEDEKNLISYLASKEYPVHEPINAYLRALGDFDDPSGTEHKFRLLRLPAVEEFDDIAGFFGRVDHNTHYLYESLPALGVSALRVLKDLEYTRGAIQANWDLPEALRPPPVPGLPVEAIVEEDEALPFKEREVMVERPRNLPTANLLCWGPAVRLTSEQRQTLENCGIEDGFTTQLSRFALNGGLFEMTADRIWVSTDRYKAGASLHEHKYGSLVQCAYVEKEPGPQPFSRNIQYCDGTLRASSAHQLDVRLAVGAIVSALRMRKEACNQTHNWAYNRYRNVPRAWIDNRNTVFDYGHVAALNAGTKHTAYTNKDRLRTPLLSAGVVKKSSF